MPKSLADMILGARQRSNTQKSRFVTDDEIGGYVNDGVKALMDRIIAADDSYYQGTMDFTPAGVTEAGASTALPNDFARMRRLTQFPDTPRSRQVYAVAQAKVNRGELGYYLNGNSITISPFYAAPRGPWRLVYVPKAPQFGLAIDVHASSDNLVVALDGFWTFQSLNATSALIGAQLVISGSSFLANNGTFPITGVQSTTELKTSSAGLSAETFGSKLTASILLPFVANPYQAASITQLDTTMDTYDEVPELWAAYRILDKKKQLGLSDVPALLEAAWGRVDAMAAGRVSEPEAAPCLWRPSWNGVDPWGGNGGFDGF